MEKLMKWVEEKLVPPMAKIGTQRHLLAIRNGVVSTLSLILIGTFFMVFINLPFPGWNEFIAPYSATIVLPFRITMGLMAIYATFVMGSDLAKSYGLDSVTGGILSLGTFFMLQVPVNVLTPEEAPLGWVLPMSSLGASGMFAGILSMIFAVEVYRFFKKRNITIKMPEQVPPAVARSFEALIPGAVILTTTWLIRSVAGFDVNAALLSLFEPLTNILGNNLLGVLLPMFLIHLLWSFGIHGMSIVGAVVRPMWLIMLDENAKALADGTAATKLPYIAPEQFYQWTVTIGGAGATIVVSVLFLFFCKSKFLKEVGRFSIIPGIFNINEPMIFGAPMMLNPYMFIPFNLVPLVLTIVSYFAVKLEMVNGFTVLPTWTLPAPIGGYLSAGNDWRVVVLIVINTLIAFIIYYPFVKAYDKKMLSDEQNNNGDNEIQTS
ncbi:MULTISPECIES: PTS sugar transporter subunit IIC [Enterococcus]|uniref:PTS sugar transporter subunit IIC n=1 Tax=Enterococcus TaxID=1350 RepID=UPI00019CCDB0|nr:PTS transporter subunit EIIC [Enterococcus faecium]EEI60720.1 putative PTS system, cellobiose-specific IIC component [Enterococcus faecium TX1330]EGP5445081.1 PTS sugar transporter subunit IIC [Enterococcus faecium]EME8261631.1 PTS sugar transporter subunit IIC [Enterococcus faecium]MEB5660700.1 PTS transporter subunit EIIC [Enterococcus faecium]RIX95908.1 PTS sugar transporter subunit IIC [Enterococcus faecium TX1330]